jgi:CRISPR-associated protein Csd1
LAVSRFLEAWQSDAEQLSRYQREVIGTNVAFRLDGIPEFIHDRDAARILWLQYLTSRPATLGRCLITASANRIALTHPAIGGVRGAKPSGAFIVSFNQESFVSYDKKQGQNAPVSEHAAFAYTTVLNDLLSRDSQQKVQIGDATTVFWAEAEIPENADAGEQAAAFLFAPSPDQLDNAATSRLSREVMQCFEKGRPLENPELHLDPGTRFYILGLSPNSARLSVRFWEATTLGALGWAFHQHWQDLRIETPPVRGLPPSIAALTLRTAPARVDQQGKIKFSFRDVSPLIAGEVMRAILNGGRYPGSLLTNLVMRVRTDGVLDRTRVSLIKATITRAMRLEGRLPQENYLVRTDPDDPNAARRLGRLFAVLERAQAAALGDKINATVKDKYLGAAAATPARVFPGLITNANHHTARLRKGHTDAKWVKKPAAVGFALDRDIGYLAAQFNDGFPSQQTIEEQGLFLIGYYQERFGGKPDDDIGEEPGVDATLVDETNDDEQE